MGRFVALALWIGRFSLRERGAVVALSTGLGGVASIEEATPRSSKGKAITRCSYWSYERRSFVEGGPPAEVARRQVIRRRPSLGYGAGAFGDWRRSGLLVWGVWGVGLTTTAVLEPERGPLVRGLSQS